MRTTLAGLARFGAIVALAAGIAVGVALLIGWWRTSDLLRAAILGLYIGGAILVAVPLLSWQARIPAHPTFLHRELELELEAAGRQLWQGTQWLYVAVGVMLVGIGVALETLA